jgi:hypothetical protein
MDAVPDKAAGESGLGGDLLGRSAVGSKQWRR